MFWCNTQKAIEILKSLKGTKILIKGNHDDCRDTEFRSYFKYIKDFVKEVKFDHLGVFAFSNEEDTEAYSMDNQVDEKIAKDLNSVSKM